MTVDLNLLSQGQSPLLRALVSNFKQFQDLSHEVVTRNSTSTSTSLQVWWRQKMRRLYTTYAQDDGGDTSSQGWFPAPSGLIAKVKHNLTFVELSSPMSTHSLETQSQEWRNHTQKKTKTKKQKKV